MGMNHSEKYLLMFKCSAWMVFLFLVPGCEREAGNGKPLEDKVSAGLRREVEVIEVRRMGFESSVSAVGSLAPIEESLLGVKVSGRVRDVAMDIGSVVEAGDLLARIEPEDYEAQLRQAEAMLSQSKAVLGIPNEDTGEGVDLEETSLVRQALAAMEESRRDRDRVVSLSEGGVVSQSELEAAESDYRIAASRHQEMLDEARRRLAQLDQRRAEVDLARQNLDATEIHAPFSGIVEKRLAYKGEFLKAGDPVAVLVRNDVLRLKLEVAERDAPRIRLGQQVRLSVTGDDIIYQGELRRISPRLDELSRMLLVEAEVVNPGNLRGGQFVTARIILADEEMALAVPEDCIVTFAGIEKAVTVDHGKAQEKELKSGRRSHGMVEILRGLNAGEWVVRNPGSLHTGELVEVSSDSMKVPD